MEARAEKKSIFSAAEDDPTLLGETWKVVSEEIQRKVDIPIVWLAMQEVTPLAIEDNLFVAGMPSSSYYLSINLQMTQTRVAIEEAIERITGRPLEFHLIDGDTIEAWKAEKERRVSVTPQSFRTIPKAALGRNAQQVLEAAQIQAEAAGSVQRTAPASKREVMKTWDKLHEHLAVRYKTAPSMKYAFGQARFILECMQSISDTMDVLMPDYVKNPDTAAERNLVRELERLGSQINLDPIFLSLELLRYRASQGKDIGLP